MTCPRCGDRTHANGVSEWCVRCPWARNIHPRGSGCLLCALGMRVAHADVAGRAQQSAGSEENLLPSHYDVRLSERSQDAESA